MTCSIASAIITDATPRKKPRKRGWRRAANERVSLMVYKLLESPNGPTGCPVLSYLRPHAAAPPAGPRAPGRASAPPPGPSPRPGGPGAAGRVSALRLDRERGPPWQPAAHGGARRRGADPLRPG